MLKISFWLNLVVCIGLIPVMPVQNHFYKQSFQCYQLLAAKGGDAQEIKMRLSQYKQALLDHGLEQGDYQPVFVRPDKTHEANHSQIDSLIRRADELMAQGESSIAYQMALFQDFREQVKHLPDMAATMSWYHYWWFVAVWIFGVVWFVFSGVRSGYLSD